MQDLIGKTLSHYRVIEKLGAGGMGEVYRARDTRLGRDVAIKVLSAQLSATPEARARFEREAQTISRLNHPRICTLHDVGREGDTDYLVMELVEGETLAHRLERGPLPTDEVLRLGAEIAEALDRAHRAGVIHRDLKPGNVMLTKGGAKLMDFGLARGGAPIEGGGGPAESPTMSHPLTTEGALIGTFQYMAPEQLEGKEADARSDLWALGCVLYEMATGSSAFEGRSRASLIAAILEREPRAMREVVPLAPPALERLVRQCLAKDPDDRWQSAGDVGRELRWIAEPGSSDATPGPLKRPQRERLAWGVAAVCAVAALAATVVVLRAGGPSNRHPTFAAVTYRPMAIFRAAFAPDGKTIVFSGALEGNTPHLFVIRPEYPEPQPFGDPGTQLLSVSRTGELAVLTGAEFIGHRLCRGTLSRMPLGGGAPREILEDVREADWAPDGSGLAIIHDVSGEDRLEFPIGHVLYASGGYLSDLRFSSRGDRIAFFEHPSRFDDRGSVNVVDLHGRKTLLSGGYWGEEGIAWSGDGREVLFSAGLSGYQYRVYAVTLGGRRRVALESAGGQTIQDVSADGRWLTTRDDQSIRVMVHIPPWTGDRDLSWLGGSIGPILSQDGRTLVFTELSSVVGNTYAVCLRRTDGGDVVRLGEGSAHDLSLDGKKVLALVFSVPPRVVIYPTGAGEPLRLDLGGQVIPQDCEFFPGADSILILGTEPGRSPRYYIQRLAGGAPRAVTPEGTRDGRLSRDGAFILARGPDGQYHNYPLEGGEPRAVRGLSAEDKLISMGADGRSVFVTRGRAAIPLRLERVDIESGQREAVQEIAPTDRAGLVALGASFISDDGDRYGYTTFSYRSTLFTVGWGERTGMSASR
jgi:serine/threonine protein kinase/Tol biopolymer transport system component